MAHKMFLDATGREWLVWDVIPQSADRRAGAPRRDAEDLTTTQTDLDRRSAEGSGESPRSHAHLPETLSAGWLCFESGDEKRRLGPIPDAWERLSDAELARLVRRADRATPRDNGLDTTKLRAMARPAGLER